MSFLRVVLPTSPERDMFRVCTVSRSASCCLGVAPPAPPERDVSRLSISFKKSKLLSGCGASGSARARHSQGLDVFPEAQVVFNL